MRRDTTVGRGAMIGAGAALVFLLVCVSSARDGARALAQTPPANDAFASAQSAGNSVYEPDANDLLPWDDARSTAGATVEAGETAPCGPIGATVWFSLAANTSGTVVITSEGSDFDTILAVYTAGNGFLPSPPGANLNAVACNDDVIGTTSSLSFAMSRGVQYYIQAGGKGSATGNLRLHIACEPACPPPNDEFFGPSYLYIDAYTPSQTQRTRTDAATTQPGEQAPCGSIGKTVWYQLNIAQDADVVLDTAGSDFDTVVAVYEFKPTPDGPFEPTPTRVHPIACEAADGGPASLTTSLAAGWTYWVQVGGVSSASGKLTFSVSCDPACPPYNDSLGTPDYLTGNVMTQVPTAGATVDPGEPRDCGTITHTVWYQLYAYGETTFVLDSSSSDYSTRLALYEVRSPVYPLTYDQLSLLKCGDDGGDASRISFTARPNHVYLLQAGGRGDSAGLLQLSVACVPEFCPPENDGAASPYAASVPWSFPYSSAVDTRGATVEDGEPTDCGDMGKTVWYLIDSPVDVTIRFDTNDSDFETGIAVYDADFPFSPPGGMSHRIACAVSEAGLRAHLDFPVAAGHPLYLQVGGIGGAGGMLQLHGDCVPACPPQNDNLGMAFDVSYGDSFDSPYTVAATLEPGEPHDCGNMDATVWYRYSASAPGSFTVDLTGSEIPPAVAVYRIDGFSPPPGSLTQLDCHTGGDADRFEVADAGLYYIQIGGVDGARGRLQVHVTCDGCGGGGVVGPDTGPGGGGAVSLPDTGSGGYLPGAHRR